MKIERIKVNGEARRRFFLVAEVTFSDQKEDGDHNYYEDDELRDVMTGWVDAALDDRDDGPDIVFHETPFQVTDTMGSRIAWEWVIEANNSGGIDAGDLAGWLERAGFPCPTDLEED